MAGSVGFVGLGKMGGPMALNLVKAGFELVVHDINSARLEPLVAAGATVGVFGSERLTGALLDRLTHHVHILEMNGDSYRLKQSKQRQRQT
jgi:6-phosphogluconate dehydrogenase (decarboxylating)